MNFNVDTFYSLLDIIFLIPFLFALNQVIFKMIRKRHEFFSVSLINKLFFYHLFFGMVYYIYATLNRSDSHKYFSWPQKIGKSWSGFFGTETTFINFI